MNTLTAPTPIGSSGSSSGTLGAAALTARLGIKPLGSLLLVRLSRSQKAMAPTSKLMPAILVIAVVAALLWA